MASSRRRSAAAQEYRRPDRRQWHFDKRISLDTVVAVVGMGLLVGGPILVWGRAMEGRVQVLEVTNLERSKTETTRDQDAREYRVLIANRLDKLDEKVTQMQIQIGRIVPSQSPR